MYWKNVPIKNDSKDTQQITLQKCTRKSKMLSNSLEKDIEILIIYNIKCTFVIITFKFKSARFTQLMLTKYIVAENFINITFEMQKR